MKLNFKAIPIIFTLISLCQGSNVSNVKRTNIPELTNITCGDNTKTCNIGFDEISVNIYGVAWNLEDPIATKEDTLRKKKNDSDEKVSMVATIRSFNMSFDVYITGSLYSGGCINDKNNYCKIDAFISQNTQGEGNISLQNLEDKTPKLIRFQYSDWTGKCYKTWRLTFDIQGTRNDLTNWYWYYKININNYY